MSTTTTHLPDIAAHLDAAERAGAAFCNALLAALAAVPEGDAYHHTTREIGKCVEGARIAGDLSAARSALAEAARVKGPMVTICYPMARGGVSASRAELAEVTGAALIMRNGERYGRRTGVRAGHRGWHDAPFITAEERARVLALPRPPAAAAKKAPK